MRYVLLAVTVVFLLSGCDSEAKYKADLELMCDAPMHESVQKANPTTKQTTMATVISEGIETQKARELFKSFANMSPEARKEALEAEVEQAGIDDCPLTKVWQ